MSFKTWIIGAVLVALVVVGSIAAIQILATRVDTAKQNASIRVAQTQVDLFDTELQLYDLDMDEFPSEGAGFAALKAVPQDAKRPKKWAGPYTKEIPLDPWGHPYHYQFPGPRHADLKPDVWSSGPDGQSGTSDDIVNK